ncbi:MAG TPA: type II toxin-antitoxin system VapC family toxin [Isosphaeraceae bacterium]
MTSLLLDTLTMLWFVWDDPQLSSSARAMIEDPNHRKLASIASCREIAIKVGLGKLNIGEPSRPFLNREITLNNVELLPISLDHATLVEGLPPSHKDPFDRLLVAQADFENLPLVSVDPIFDRYGITRMW